MKIADLEFILADGIAGAAAIGSDFTVLRKSGRLSEWLPEVGRSCFECEFLIGLEEDLIEQKSDPLAQPVIMPEMRMMVGRIAEKITIFIRWDAARDVFAVLTTRDQMARPIDEWMARRAREQRILEEKIAEQAQELARINQDLEFSNTQLKQFSAVAAHDLQSPLRQIAAFARLLLERPAVRVDRVAADYITTMDASLRRMQKMVASLLHYARLSARTYDFADVDMMQVIDEARQNLSGLIEESGAQIKIEPLPRAFGDSVLLAQVWQNLIANALQHCAEAPPQLVICARPVPGFIEYALSDNGVGIDREKGDALFEMFRRGETAAPGGSGIGLSLCLRIIEIHCGKIWFDAGYSPGTRICFTVPLPIASNRPVHAAH